jgi:lipoate-protein ligase A
VSDTWEVTERSGQAAKLHASWPEAERSPDRRRVALCRVTSPAVVLGSTQPLDVVDARRAAAMGIAVARRRSGGGAVLVTPENPVWMDVWLPAGDPLWAHDVGRAFDWLGESWAEALDTCGVAGTVPHRGGFVDCTRWSSLVCFGGVGSGEILTPDGRKVVGLSQRRTRLGAWFHTACMLHWDPSTLLGVLDLPDAERDAASSALAATVAGVQDLLVESGSPTVDAATVGAALIAALP